MPTRAVFTRLASSAVYERNIIVDFIIGNCIFELRLLAPYQLIGTRDFEDHAAGTGSAFGFCVAGTFGNSDCGGTVL